MSIGLASATNHRHVSQVVHAYRLIQWLDAPVLRRVLQAMLVFEHGYTPDSVTAVLKSLREGRGPGVVIRGEYRLGEYKHHVYSLREPWPSELRYLEAKVVERDRVLTRQVLKGAAEMYFRSLLIASGRFTNICQERRLGVITDSEGSNALDLVAQDKHTRLIYGISVKNQNAWLDPRARDKGRAVKDCYVKASAHGIEPWLVVPFASSEGIEYSDRMGVRLTVLGRQVVPAKASDGRRMQSVIDGLRCAVGPQPFEYLYARFDRTLSRSMDAQIDVQKMAA